MFKIQPLAVFKTLLFIVILVVIASCGREPAHMGFAFYNVENLFDTIDDPRINDNSYLPDSKIPWNTKRYNTKLNHLAEVMSNTDTTSGYPVLFGLCEIENIHVLKDLVNHPKLKNAEYQIVHHDSPDERGIDVALLYQEKYFTPVKYSFLTLHFPFSPDSKTRDILYTKGILAKKDTLHVFINHWTSRWGGREETDPKRKFTGEFLKSVTDSILRLNPAANILIAGDLNDNPTDPSVAEKLGALPVTTKIIRQELYNLSLAGYAKGDGTLYYKSWDMFDQIIVSGNLLFKNNIVHVSSPEQRIIKYDWMLYQPENGPARPNRTASGKYFGGYSDHLPVFIDLEVK